MGLCSLCLDTSIGEFYLRTLIFSSLDLTAFLDALRDSNSTGQMDHRRIGSHSVNYVPSCERLPYSCLRMSAFTEFRLRDTKPYAVLLTLQGDAKAVRLIVVLVVILQAAVALCFKVLFFSVYPKEQIGVKDPISIVIGDDKTSSILSSTQAASSIATAAANATATAAMMLARRWFEN